MFDETILFSMPIYETDEIEVDGVTRVIPKSVNKDSCLRITEEAWISEESEGMSSNTSPTIGADAPSHLEEYHPNLYNDIEESVKKNCAIEIFSYYNDRDRKGGPRTSVMNYLIMNEGLRKRGWAIAEKPKQSNLLEALEYNPEQNGVQRKQECLFTFKDIGVEIDARKEGCLAEIQFGNRANMVENISYQFQIAKHEEPAEVKAAVMVVPSTNFTKYVSNNTANFRNTKKYLDACWHLTDPNNRVPTTVLGIGFENEGQATLS